METTKDYSNINGVTKILITDGEALLDSKERGRQYIIDKIPSEEDRKKCVNLYLTVITTPTIDIKDFMEGMLMELPNLEEFDSNSYTVMRVGKEILNDISERGEKRNLIMITGISKKNNVIGNKGKLPWRNKLDMRILVKRIGESDVVIGRVSSEELTKPLGKGINYVITREPESFPEREGFVPIRDMKELIQLETTKDIYVCGGESIYEETIELSDLGIMKEKFIFSAVVHMMDYDVVGDRFFPMNEMLTNGYLYDHSTLYISDPDSEHQESVEVVEFKKESL